MTQRLFLIAGEVSGDILGARLIAALKRRWGEDIELLGVGGPRMQAEGLTSLFPMEELSLMGVAEVLPHLPRLLRRIRETAQAVREARPAALITIDAPAFTLRVARRLGPQAGIPRIHYVAPQVWAWRQGRAKGVARSIDHLMALLPFEPDFFARYGLPCTYTGHPVIESGADRGDGAGFRARFDIAADTPVLLLLPGSRVGEVTRHLEIFRQTAANLVRSLPDLRVVIPTVPHLAEWVRAQVAARPWPGAPIVLLDDGWKYDAFAAANVALAASGTVALELALADLPCVIAYRLNPLTAALGRRLLKVPYVSLVNLIAGTEIVPERLQDACEPLGLASDLLGMITNPTRRTAIRQGYAAVRAALGHGGESPSDRAASVVLDIIAGSRR